jgi:hypothetical protein
MRNKMIETSCIILFAIAGGVCPPSAFFLKKDMVKNV